MGAEYNQPAHLLDRYIKGGEVDCSRVEDLSMMYAYDYVVKTFKSTCLLW